MWHEDDGGRGLSTGLILVTVMLLTIGVVIQASAGASLERSLVDVITEDESPLARQWLYAAIGLGVLLGASRIDPVVFRWREGRLFQPAVVVVLAAVVALALVWAPGIGMVRHGRARWIDLGVIGFQSSELAKLAVVVFLPAWLSRRVSRADRELDGANLWAAIGVLGVLCAMIGKEDFGTAFLVAAVGGATLLVNGRRTGTLLAWTLPAMGLGLTMLLMHEYRVRRFTAFLRIWEDPLGDGWHPIQSLAAIASGGWTGRGLGAGISKHGYLPEYRTDFIFALLCEEAGVIGGGIVILLFIGFVLLGMRVMVTAPAAESGSDGGFRRLFAFAATMMVGSQALMNIAVVTVMAPTKGIALPFVSAGGSSLLCYCLLVGLLAGSSRGRRDGVGDMVIAGDMGSVDAESDNRLAPEAYGAVAGLAP